MNKGRKERLEPRPRMIKSKRERPKELEFVQRKENMLDEREKERLPKQSLPLKEKEREAKIG